jgi:hypothetical protein
MNFILITERAAEILSFSGWSWNNRRRSSHCCRPVVNSAIPTFIFPTLPSPILQQHLQRY